MEYEDEYEGWFENDDAVDPLSAESIVENELEEDYGMDPDEAGFLRGYYGIA